MKNRRSLYMIAYIGVGTALTVVLIFFIRIPMFISFLEYDPGDIPIYVCTMLFGTYYGLIMTVIASVIQGLTVSASSSWIGILMHIFATGTFVLITGLVRGKSKSFRRLIAAVSFGLFGVVLTMILWNLVFTPLFMGTSMSAVIELLPLIIAFNVVKVLINGTISVAIYKICGKYIPAAEK